MPAGPSVAPLSSSAVFTPDLESKTCALFIRDTRFAREVLMALKPEHFTNAIERNIALFCREFLVRYNALPSLPTLANLIKIDKRTTAAEFPIYVANLIRLNDLDLSEREFIRDNVIAFCRRQSLLIMAAKIPDLVAKGDDKSIAQIKTMHDEAMLLGVEAGPQFMNFFDTAAERKKVREDKASGVHSSGVSTGFDEVDANMYHRGYGKGEITFWMAPSKRGKTALMGQSALYSSLKGFNNLIFSLEVDLLILGDRLDAASTGTSMGDLIGKRDDVALKVSGFAGMPGMGKLWLERRPANTLTAKAIEATIQSYLNAGHKLDAVFVDYLGIMKLDTPDNRYLGLGMATKELRRIGQEYNLAMVSALQTNREGLGKTVAGQDSVAESYMAVQDADLVISINANEAELAEGVRRLHWAASRNTAEATIKVQGDLDKMQPIQTILEIKH